MIGVLIFISLAGICDAIMDTLAHHYSVSMFKNFNPYFWNPDVSWLSKYKEKDPAQGRVKWAILGLEINKPVSFTDAWHLFKRLKITFWCIAIGILTNWWWILIVAVLRNFSFHVCYKWLLLDKGRRCKKFKEFFQKIWWKLIIVYICVINKFKK